MIEDKELTALAIKALTFLRGATTDPQPLLLALEEIANRNRTPIGVCDALLALKRVIANNPELITRAAKRTPNAHADVESAYEKARVYKFIEDGKQQRIKATSLHNEAAVRFNLSRATVIRYWEEVRDIKASLNKDII